MSRVIHKNAFKYDTRTIDDGAGKMIPRVHMIACCKKCGNESAIALDAHNTQYNIDKQCQSFNRIGWKMGSTRRRDVCPVCVARGKVGSAPLDQRRAIATEEVRRIEDLNHGDLRVLDGLIPPTLVEVVISDTPTPAPARPAPKPVFNADAGAPRAGQADLRGRRAPKDGSVHIFKPEPVQPVTMMAEKLRAADEVRKAAALAELKAETAQSDRNKQQAIDEAARMNARRHANRPPEEDEELKGLIDQQARDDGRTRRRGKTAPMPLPKSFIEQVPKLAKPAPVIPATPPKPLVVTKAPKIPLILLEGGITLAPVVAPTPNLPAVVVTQVEAVETPVKKGSGLSRAEYWASDASNAQKAAQLLGRQTKAAKKRGIPVEQYIAEQAEEAIVKAARIAERDRKRALKDAILAERQRTDPMLNQPELNLIDEALAPIEMDLEPVIEAEPEVLEAPEPQPEVAPPAPVEAIKETPMPTAEAPRQPTPEERRRLYMEFVDAYYDDGRGMYRGDMSDEKLSKKLGFPRAWITQLREHTGGEDVNEETQQIEKDVTALQQQIERNRVTLDESLSKAAEALDKARKTAATSLEEARVKAAEAISKIERDLKRDIHAAEESVTKIAAEGETARAASEQRVVALLERLKSRR